MLIRLSLMGELSLRQTGAVERREDPESTWVCPSRRAPRDAKSPSGVASDGRLRAMRLLLLVLLLLFGPPAAAQSPPEDDFDSLGIRIDEVVSVEHVLVPLVVRSRKGFRYDLEPKQFRLFVDDRRVPIESFERGADAPMSIVVLNDLSGSMAHMGKLDAGLEVINYYLDRLRPKDEMALATFTGGRTVVEVPFTSDVSVLRESIGLWQAWGTTAIYDAVAALPEISLTGQRGKLAALLITDGVDNASEMSLPDAQLLVQRAELPVYVFGLETYRRPDDDVFRYVDLLQLLADGTGGRYYRITNLEEARQASAAIFTELRHQYVLGFSVRGYGPDQYHPIRVEVTRRRSRVVHRLGYRGSAPAAWER